MFQLKPLSREGVSGALAKAERYRLLNEPEQAESICLDILEVEPDNPQALVILILALTDQFRDETSGVVARAREVVDRLRSEYERAYYAGIVSERRARTQLARGGPQAGVIAYDGFSEAMAFYTKAEALRPPGNDDALLRWNTCARLLSANAALHRAEEERVELPLE